MFFFKNTKSTRECLRNVTTVKVSCKQGEAVFILF